jgi:lysozyme
MKLSYNGIQFLKEREGFREDAYLDTGGVWTIGYGTTKRNGKPVEPGMRVSVQEAEEDLQADLTWAQTCVNQGVKVKLSQNMFDALVSFVYNIGETAFKKSTMLRLLNLGLYELASAQFNRWIYDNGEQVGGLINRRKLERDLFEKR